MLKKILLSIAVLLIFVVILGFVFKEPLREVVYREVTKDMFVEADEDNFEPGVPGTQVGNNLPPVRVSFEGAELNSLAQFAGSRGLVVMFSRSVLW